MDAGLLRHTVFSQLIPVDFSDLRQDVWRDGQGPIGLEPEKNQAGVKTFLVSGRFRRFKGGGTGNGWNPLIFTVGTNGFITREV